MSTERAAGDDGTRREIRRPVLWAVVGVCLAAAAIRVAMLFSVPLILTNDSVHYIAWAAAILDGEPLRMPSYRTPGYPVFLAGAVALLGRGPMAVLAAQHLLGVLTAGLVGGVAASVVARARSPRLALITGVACGLLVALDPRPLALESFLLSETLASFLFVVLVVLPLALRRFHLAHALWIGVAAAAGCLVRPAFQIAVPFVLLGFVLLPGVASPRRRGLGLAIAAAAFVAVAGPWLVHNHRRGVSGFGEGAGPVLWLGLAMSDRLDPALAPTPELAGEYDRIVGGAPNEDTLHQYVFRVGSFRDAEVRRHVTGWALASIAADPAAYATGVFHALLWQCDYKPAWTRPYNRELRWMGRRVGARFEPRGPAPNFSTSAPPGPELQPFVMQRRSAGIARLFDAWASQRDIGALTLLLLGSAVAAGVVSLLRRDWPRAALVAATGAVIFVHAILLSPYERYSMPVWIAWAVTPALLVASRWRSHATVLGPRGSPRRTGMKSGAGRS